MPELDYALVADYVRPEGGVAHVIAAGIDTIIAPQVPIGQNVGLLVRLTFTRQESDRDHKFEAIFQDVDGQRLVQIATNFTPPWDEGLPAGWRKGMQVALNLGLPLPTYGVYSLEILVNDNSVHSIPIRVVPPEAPDKGVGGEAPTE